MRILINLILLLLFAVSSNAQTVKVMSYNIRYDTEADGVNQWHKRIEKVVQLIKSHNPDLLGVQEALHNQVVDLQESLPDYHYVGVGRDDGKEKGEYSAIFYKKNKFEILEQKTRWLSETPEVPGSKSWDAAITRVVTYAVLKEKATGKSFALFNTHFDHIGKEARKNSAQLIKKFIKDLNAITAYKEIPLLVSGDFNSQPTEEPYQTMINGIDVTLYDSRPASDLTGTSCGFEVGARKCNTIDYIFHSSHWKSTSYLVIQANNGKYYPSDHLPVLASFTMK